MFILKSGKFWFTAMAALLVLAAARIVTPF
jgi:hypothetical protein